MSPSTDIESICAGAVISTCLGKVGIQKNAGVDRGCG